MFGATRPDGSFDPNCTVPLGMRSPIAASDPEERLAASEASHHAPPEPFTGAHEEWRVCDGDTLSSIAERAYGDPRRWPEVFAANRDRLTNPRKLPPGTTLRIPR
jgi:Ca2+-transporting ATPase